MNKFLLSAMKHIHFMGIAGSGASAVAAIAKSQGYKVTGCDMVPPFNEFTKNLDKTSLLTGHSPDHLKDVDILAISPAITSLDPKNPELLAAKERGIEVLTWQQFLGKYLTKDKFIIAVCGTHGKSTTTAMIGELLEDTNLDPTVELGAIVPRWDANYRVGKGHYFVVEADEFNDNFLSFTPDITVITNIEFDHPEYFKDIKAVKESFKKFLKSTKKQIIANISDRGVGDVLKDVMKEVPIPAVDYSKNHFDIELKIPGEFNKLNASAVLQVGLTLGIDTKTIRKSLSSFTGIDRRFEYLGKLKGADVYSDFGHHPTEIKVTMEAAREKFPNKKIWLIYEPHMFTRTKALFDEFIRVFRSLPVDQIVIIDIYPSREKDTGTVHSNQLALSTGKDHITYNNPEQLKETLLGKIKPGDVVFFMGAGDIDQIARKMVEKNA